MGKEHLRMFLEVIMRVIGIKDNLMGMEYCMTNIKSNDKKESGLKENWM